MDLTGTWHWHNQGWDTPRQQLVVPKTPPTGEAGGQNVIVKVEFEPVERAAPTDRPTDLPLTWHPPWFHSKWPMDWEVGPSKSQGRSAIGHLWAHVLPGFRDTRNVVLHMIRTHYDLAGTEKAERSELRMYYVGALEEGARPPSTKASFFGHVVNNTADTRIQTFRLYR